MKSPRALCSGNPGKWGFPSIASHQIRPLRLSLGARQSLIPHCTLQIPARPFHPHSLGLLISSQLTDFGLNLHSFGPCAMFPPTSIASGSSGCTSNISTFCSPPDASGQIHKTLKAVGKHQIYFQGLNCKLHPVSHMLAGWHSKHV